ncbi:hypothetical protein D3C81_2319390 [compost metagenome]
MQQHVDFFILHLVLAEPDKKLIHPLPPILVRNPEFPHNFTEHLQILVRLQRGPVRQTVA